MNLPIQAGYPIKFLDNPSKRNRGMFCCFLALDIFVSSAGTEELAHLEMVSAIVYQLTKDLTEEQIKKSGFDTYFVDHTTGVYPVAASGTPFSAETFSVAGDALTDLHEDLAAEQKARTTYDNICHSVMIMMCEIPSVSYGSGKLFTISDLEKLCESPRIIWIRKTSMHLIRNLIGNGKSRRFIRRGK